MKLDIMEIARKTTNKNLILTVNFFSFKTHHFHIIKPKGRTLIMIFTADKCRRINKTLKEFNNGAGPHPPPLIGTIF